MVDVDHQLPGGECGRLGQKGLSASLAPWTRQPVAEHIGLGDHGETVRLKSMLDGQHRALRRFASGAGDAEAQGVRIRCRQPDVLEAMIPQHGAQPVRRPVRPGGEENALALGAERLGVGGHRLEQIDAVLRAFGGEATPRPRAEIGDNRGWLLDEGRKLADRVCGDVCRPKFLIEVEGAGRKGPIVRSATDLRRLSTRIIGVIDHGDAFVNRIFSHVIEQDKRGVAEVVEHRLRPLVEQRQIVLHPSAATAFAHSRIERVVGGGPEQLDEPSPKARNRGFVDKRFADGQQLHPVELARRALGHRVKAPDGVEGVAKEIETNRFRRGWRKDVDHAPPYGELALLGHCRRANITVHSEIALKLGDRNVIADLSPKARLPKHPRRR